MSSEQAARPAEAELEPQADAAEANVGAEKQLTNKEKRLLKKQEKAQQKAAAGGAERIENSKVTAEEKTNVPAVGEKKRKRDDEGAGDDGPQGEEQEQEAEEEVEPLSHKEQRKRRKLEKQLEKKKQSFGEGEGEAPDSTEAVKDEKDLPARSPFSVWIGNMSFRTSPQRIQEWLEEHEIQGITRVHMPKGVKRGEYNKG